MQYKIPQDISTEDKLITIGGGGLSLRQLIIVMVGGGFAYLIYVSLAKLADPIVYVPPMVVVGILTLAVAFFKRDNLTFTRMMLRLLETAINPTRRIWVQMGGDLSPLAVLEQLTQVEKPKPGTTAEAVKQDAPSLSKLVEIIDYDPNRGVKIQGENDLFEPDTERASWVEKLSQKVAQKGAAAIKKQPDSAIADENLYIKSDSV